ncbi:MAG: ATP-binding protein, partial [Prosthecobacter sp.]
TSLIAVSAASRWGLACWLFAAAIVAAVTSVLLLRRQHQLMRDFAEAEALLDAQRCDLEQANSSLLHSQKMKALGTLAAGMAHDFNNMLSVIRMSNKLIARETRGNTEVTELVASVESAVLQGKQVVRSMLSYSRAEDDHAPHRPIAVVVQDAAALLSTEFLSGITLKMSLDERAPEVDASNSSIQQILLNLIVNASEAMKGTGSLTITVRRATAQDTAICVLPPQRAAEYVEICVADTGPGIPAEIAERIFEPFFTTKNAGNDRGTGLGLSMVYTIAERDGMGLALRSIVGQGAAFYIFLPVSPVRESHTDVHATTA